MAKRKSIGKKLRFEVMKRDSFSCQYCGAKAPDVLLHIDHIAPVAKGGDNDILNLITACSSCNLGKGSRELSDASAVAKKADQLADLQARREQIEMMVEWQTGLAGLDDVAVNGAIDLWESFAVGWRVSDSGRQNLRKWINKYGLQDVLTAIRKAAADCNIGADSDADQVASTWDLIERIARFAKSDAAKPYLRDLFYIRGIVRNRHSSCNERVAIQLLEAAYLAGESVDRLKQIALDEYSWTAWRNAMQDISE